MLYVAEINLGSEITATGATLGPWRSWKGNRCSLYDLGLDKNSTFTCWNEHATGLWLFDSTDGFIDKCFLNLREGTLVPLSNFIEPRIPRISYFRLVFDIFLSEVFLALSLLRCRWRTQSQSSWSYARFWGKLDLCLYCNPFDGDELSLSLSIRERREVQYMEVQRHPHRSGYGGIVMDVSAYRRIDRRVTSFGGETSLSPPHLKYFTFRSQGLSKSIDILAGSISLYNNPQLLCTVDAGASTTQASRNHAFQRRGLGLHKETRYASPPKKRVIVTWMARRSSVQVWLNAFLEVACISRTSTCLACSINFIGNTFTSTPTRQHLFTCFSPSAVNSDIYFVDWSVPLLHPHPVPMPISCPLERFVYYPAQSAEQSLMRTFWMLLLVLRIVVVRSPWGLLVLEWLSGWVVAKLKYENSTNYVVQ